MSEITDEEIDNKQIFRHLAVCVSFTLLILIFKRLLNIENFKSTTDFDVQVQKLRGSIFF